MTDEREDLGQHPCRECGRVIQWKRDKASRPYGFCLGAEGCGSRVTLAPGHPGPNSSKPASRTASQAELKEDDPGRRPRARRETSKKPSKKQGKSESATKSRETTSADDGPPGKPERRRRNPFSPWG